VPVTIVGARSSKALILLGNLDLLSFSSPFIGKSINYESRTVSRCAQGNFNGCVIGQKKMKVIFSGVMLFLMTKAGSRKRGRVPQAKPGQIYAIQ